MKKSIIPNGDSNECYFCLSPATDRHHCLHGSYRKLADEYGLTVNLCHSCHMALHDKGTGDKELQKLAQITWENVYGDRMEFIRVFGKSFILD